jgi:hypothetical protein
MELMNIKNVLNISVDIEEDLFVRFEILDVADLPVDLTVYELRSYLRQQGKKSYEYLPYTALDGVETNVFYLSIPSDELKRLYRKDNRTYEYYVTLKNDSGETKVVSGELFLS